MDLSNWMRDLDNTVKSNPIIRLAIPGSHDSVSYSIKPNSPLAPDAEPAIVTLTHMFGPITQRVIHKWCVTQRSSVNAQLHSGIRYFDMRVATKVGDKKFYFVHGLYGEDISISMNEIINFLGTHPEEVVILDFQHFYAVSGEDHNRLMFLIEDTFGALLCPVSDPSSVSLASMIKNSHQVILIYRNQAREGHQKLWPGAQWPTPWPETMSCDELVNFLDARLNKRSLDFGFISQCILTPTKCTVLSVWSSLNSKCARPAASVCIPWIKSRPPGLLNVAIADYVLENDCAFPRAVIALNKTSE